MKRFLTVCTAVIISIGVSGGHAAADINGSCEASVADLQVRGRSASDPADAIRINADRGVRIEANSSAVIGRYRIEMEFAGAGCQRSPRGIICLQSAQQQIQVRQIAQGVSHVVIHEQVGHAVQQHVHR